jgi:hypothetical protein
MALTAPVISSTVSAHAQCHQQGAHLRGVASPDIMVSKLRAASSRLSVAPVAALAIRLFNSSVTLTSHTTRRLANARRFRPVDAFSHGDACCGNFADEMAVPGDALR